MKITAIGINGPLPDKGGASSCYLVENKNTKIVLDMGSGAISSLRKYINLNEIDAIILSHLHYDHFCDVLPLAYYGKRFTLIVPSSPSECFSLLKACKNFDIKVLCSSLTLDIGGMNIEFTPTIHPV